MKVGRILESKGSAVETIGPGASIAQAVHRLTTAGIGALVVTDDGGAVTGTLSEGDVVRALSRAGAGALELTVGQCMTRDAPVCTPETLVQEAMATMTRRRQRHLPVVHDGALRGLISLGDVVKNRLDELEIETNVLREAYISHR